ncbi:hypothetical protein GCM10009000_045270 [Halobacterium noricense]|uniref:Uncharacterized protein n=1 Tax=Haladaptatus pallidirubidus TaxID=1008152 RepID=A0AAV3UF77_9EURY
MTTTRTRAAHQQAAWAAWVAWAAWAAWAARCNSRPQPNHTTALRTAFRNRTAIDYFKFSSERGYSTLFEGLVAPRVVSLREYQIRFDSLPTANESDGAVSDGYESGIFELRQVAVMQLGVNPSRFAVRLLGCNFLREARYGLLSIKQLSKDESPPRTGECREYN